MNNTNLGSLMEMVASAFPEKTVVDISEFENEDHQTYKYLYEGLNEKHNEAIAETFSLHHEIQELQKEIQELSEELEKYKKLNGELNEKTFGIIEFLKNYAEKEIYITDVKAKKINGEEILTNEKYKGALRQGVSDKPAIYGTSRPSWFKPVKKALSKSNMSKKYANNTNCLFARRLHIIKSFFSKVESEEISPETANEMAMKLRKKRILELLDSECSNYEKYIKYFMLTPALTKDYMDTLTKACELGLDANVVIELLEQPAECFNKEIIELYITQTHKATDYNAKKELALELIRGEWYVEADINGHTQKFQMTPMHLIEEVNDKLNSISSILSEMANEKLCANLTQSFSNGHKDEEEIDEMETNIDYTSFVDFDESMLGDM